MVEFQVLNMHVSTQSNQILCGSLTFVLFLKRFELKAQL